MRMIGLTAHSYSYRPFVNSLLAIASGPTRTLTINFINDLHVVVPMYSAFRTLVAARPVTV